MPDEPWRPLRARHDREKQREHDALFLGVPQWLQQTLIDWLRRNFFVSSRGEILPYRLSQVEIEVRVPLDWRYGLDPAYQSLIRQCRGDDELFLSVVDLAVRELGTVGTAKEAVDRLDQLLTTAGSGWMLAPDRRGLVKRVGTEVAQAARRVVESWPDAGRYLAEAWSRIYGRNPDPSGGYREAVRAIEAAVCPVIIPRDTLPTLGKAIKALRDAPSGKYTTVFEDSASGKAPLNSVIELLELVWTSQLDRHGTTDESVPLHVTQEQAEAALHAALTLVQWFSSGVVRRA